MDIYCPVSGCAEPIDNDSLHDAVDDGLFPNYSEAASAFRRKGCEAIGFTHSTGNNNGHAEAASVLYELLGDDMDGASAMMEDFLGGW